MLHSCSCGFSPAHLMRNYNGPRAAIFTSPLSPAFDPFLYQALLFSISSLCLYYFRLYEALGAPTSSRTHLLARATATSSPWPLMKIHSCLRLLRQHTCLLFTTACAPPCGDSIIIPLLAVPIALYRIAAGARGRCLHLRLRGRSSMR
jgi:hypothetical protein